jgi:hypothetical protein
MISLAVVNLVTPKAGAMHQHWFNELASETGLLNKGSCLAAALSVIESTTVISIILVTLSCAA